MVLNNPMKSEMTCKFVKMRLFKTITRTVLKCGCETCKIYLSRKERWLTELFWKKYLKANVWTGEREWDVDNKI